MDGKGSSTSTTSTSTTPSAFKRESGDLEDISLRNGGFILVANPCDPANRIPSNIFSQSVVLITHHINSKGKRNQREIIPSF